MIVTEKKIDNDSWIICEEVNDGNTYLIQNISTDNLLYCVSSEKPSNTIFGGVVQPYVQLEFKKVSGDLYLKKDTTDVSIHISKVE